LEALIPQYEQSWADDINFGTLGVGRCFPFWQEVMGCYVVNTSATDDSGKKKCGLVLEDYYECLHHKKEVGLKHI
jgi:hypothetical protein